MIELKASITAARLKHTINVLHRVGDETIFQISDGKMVSQVMDHANAVVTRVELIAETGDYIASPEAHSVGVDLDKIASILKRASAKDYINIAADDDQVWQISRGIHQRVMRLLDPEKLRKCPASKFPHTASVTISGKEFKDIVAEADEVDAQLNFRADSNGMIFSNESDHMPPETYTATIPAARVELSPNSEDITMGIYTLEYLQDIAKDIKATDEVLVQFSTDTPCEISYEREGVKVCVILAPRIED